MCKIQPIPPKMWEALCIVSGEIKDCLDSITKMDLHSMEECVVTEYNRIEEAYKLLIEFISCHRADGTVSQRGEVPQCWNENTIWTPHRDVAKQDIQRIHPLLPFGEEENDTP